MAPKIKLIGIDLDGTALNSNKEFTKGTQDAIVRAIEAGIVVMPATGRQLTTVPEAFLNIPGVDYAVTSNGALLWDLRQKKVIFEDCFDRDTALDIVEQGFGFQSLLSVHQGGVVYTQRGDTAFLDRMLGPATAAYHRNSREMVDDLRAVVAAWKKPLEKMSMIFWDMEERKKAKALFEAREDCSVSSSLVNNIEVNTATANKGAGLLKMGELLGVPREQVMAIGDSSNDLAMMQAVGYAVAMGNAEDAILQVADAVTKSCDDEGVAAAIDAVLQS